MLILFSILGVATELRDLRRSRNFRQMCVRVCVCVCVCVGGGGVERVGGGGLGPTGRKRLTLLLHVFFLFFKSSNYFKEGVQ